MRKVIADEWRTRQTTEELRDERFGPIATEAQRIWELAPPAVER
jgi:hypothetical protein